MRRWLPFVLLLAACGPAPQTETRQPDAGAGGPSQSDPVVKPTTPVAEVKGNPDRVYQLEELKKADLSVKGNTVHAWIMDTEGKQSEGMMFLKDGDVKADQGMLFVFDSPQQTRGFWMQNTLIPLDIVYLSSTGKVLNVAHGKPLDETPIPSGGDFQYVLEMKAGTAARFGLKKGDTVPIPKL